MCPKIEEGYTGGVINSFFVAIRYSCGDWYRIQRFGATEKDKVEMRKIILLDKSEIEKEFFKLRIIR